MNLSDVSAWDAARLASAAAFGWGLVSTFWLAVKNEMTARAMAKIPPFVVRGSDAKDDDTPPGPPASA